MSTQIWQIAPQTHTQMMGYVIKSGERIIVIDGGTTGDAEYLKRLLVRLGGTRPRIDAWFLTHPHSDHMGAFLHLLTQQAGDMDVRCILHHMPPRQMLSDGEPGALLVWDAFEALRPSFKDREVLLNEGDVFEFGDTSWETLYVCDHTIAQNVSNNTSVVLRLTAQGQRVLFLGDLGVQGGDVLMAKHGKELKSDMVQMAHHGQSAVRMEVYDAIKPHICLWCTPKWLWDNNQGNRGYDSGQWDILYVRRKMKYLGVRRHVVAKDGTWRITLDAKKTIIDCYDPFAAQ